MLLSRFARSTLFNNLRLNFRYGTGCLSRETTDVLLLKGLSVQSPYVVVQNEIIQFKPKSVAADIMKDVPIEFFNNSSQSYHPLTPLSLILSQSFFIKFESVVYFVARNQPLVRDDKNTQFFLEYGGLTIQPLVKKILEDLPAEIDGKSFHNLILKNVMEYSESWKLERIRLTTLLKVVENKISYMDKMWAPIQATLKNQADKRVRTIIYLMLAQFAITNYFVYFYLSWDIMEPVTVLFGSLEVFVAYFFFVVNRREYSFKEVSENYFEKKKFKQMRKYAFDFDRYQELVDIRNHLQTKLTMRGSNVNQIIGLLQERFKLLDNN